MEKFQLFFLEPFTNHKTGVEHLHTKEEECLRKGKKWHSSLIILLTRQGRGKKMCKTKTETASVCPEWNCMYPPLFTQ